MALSAYRKTERTMAATAPGCGLSWNLLAGIGRLESSPTKGNPAAMRSVSVKGKGPKTLPSTTWSRFASDGDGDGKSDPHNLFDATLATARHLCSSGLNFHNHAQLLTALLRYNNSLSFAENVLGWAAAYATGSVPINLPPIHGSVPVLSPQQRSRTRGEPQTPLVLGTSTQAVQMLPGPGPDLVKTPPPVIAAPPEPAPWVEPPLAANVPEPALLPTAEVEVPPPVALQGDRQRTAPTETYIEPELPAQSPSAGDGGVRQGGRTQGGVSPQLPTTSAGDNGGDDGGNSDGGGRRGKRGSG